MQKLQLRDSSEVKEAAELLEELARQTAAADAARAGNRGERLQHVLEQLCTRAGFLSAVACDPQGLPLAVHDCPIPQEALVALTSLLANTLSRTADITGWTQASSLSVDLDYERKAVLKRFVVHDDPYLLLVLCPQGVDERTEIEVSIQELIVLIGGARSRPGT
jgi:hypothetical protein